VNALPGLGSRGTEVLRSQVAIEVVLTAYAIVAALLVARLVVHMLAIPRWIWTRSTIDAATQMLILPLTLLPGASGTIVGDATLPDFTAVGTMALVPLVLIARSHRAG